MFCFHIFIIFIWFLRLFSSQRIEVQYVLKAWSKIWSSTWKKKTLNSRDTVPVLFSRLTSFKYTKFDDKHLHCYFCQNILIDLSDFNRSCKNSFYIYLIKKKLKWLVFIKFSFYWNSNSIKSQTGILLLQLNQPKVQIRELND